MLKAISREVALSYCYLNKFRMIIAAIKPTIPASPKDCTKPIMFPAISPTNGTFPPSRLTAIPNASNETTTFVK